MAIPYSGGTYVVPGTGVGSFVGSTKQNIIDGIIAALATGSGNAGWTVTTGAVGATNVVLQSATQGSVTHPVRVRLKDNGGSCVQVTIENSTGTLAGTSSTSTGGSLLPATGKVYKVFASKYHFMVFTAAPTHQREFVYAGMPSVPSFLTGVTDAGFMFSNCTQDGLDTYDLQSLRTVPDLCGLRAAGTPNINVLWNATFWEVSGNGLSDIGTPCLILSRPASGGTEAVSSYRWVNGDVNESDVLIAWGSTGATAEAMIRGQLFDMAYIAESFTADVSISITDGVTAHNFWNITSANNGSDNFYPRGGLWVATS